MSYQGCGCVGGEVVTLQSELVPRDDQAIVRSNAELKIQNVKPEIDSAFPLLLRPFIRNLHVNLHRNILHIFLRRFEHRAF